MAINKSPIVVMNPNDIVATTVEKLAKGLHINLCHEGTRLEFELVSDIPFGHKVALRDIAEGEKIIKYGESIGVAIAPIAQGEHVHTQNVESCRGRGDKE